MLKTLFGIYRPLRRHRLRRLPHRGQGRAQDPRRGRELHAHRRHLHGRERRRGGRGHLRVRHLSLLPRNTTQKAGC
jgi:hypothetical protein